MVGGRPALHGKRSVGGTNLFPIAFTGSMSEAESISVVVADTASDRMQLARPIELLYAVECADFSLTFGRPRPIAEPTELDGELAKASLLSVFTGIGRAAALVGADSEIIVTNPEAEALIGDGVVVQHGRLRVSRPSDQLALERIVAAAIERGGDQFELEPIALERENGRPLIVQAMPIDPAATGRPSALLLINDAGNQFEGAASLARHPNAFASHLMAKAVAVVGRHQPGDPTTCLSESGWVVTSRNHSELGGRRVHPRVAKGEVSRARQRVL